MSTLATAKFHDSDEEDELDGDYKPAESSSKRKKPTSAKASQAKRKKAENGEEGEEESATDSGSSDDEGEGSEGERDEFRDERNQLKIEALAAEAKAREERARNLFADMQSEVAGAGSSSTIEGSGVGKQKEEEMVEIKRPRKYAGEVIYETVKLPRSDPETIAYLASQSQPPEPAANPIPPTSTSMPTSNPVASSSAAPEPPRPAPKGGPLRKKPRQSLEAMAAGLGKAKKMTTLEKSQMDWNSHLSTSTAEANELESHRRSGGYLEKRDFLDRVGDRRAESFEQNKKK